MVGCKDKCKMEQQKHPERFLRRLNKTHYKQGWRLCDECELCFVTNDLRCFCCHAKLRTKTIHKRCTKPIRVPPDQLLSYKISLRHCEFCGGKALINNRGTECWFKLGGFNDWLCNRCYATLYRTKKMEPGKRFRQLSLLVNITS
jgi:hypothetical protein